MKPEPLKAELSAGPPSGGTVLSGAGGSKGGSLEYRLGVVGERSSGEEGKS